MTAAQSVVGITLTLWLLISVRVNSRRPFALVVNALPTSFKLLLIHALTLAFAPKFQGFSAALIGFVCYVVVLGRMSRSSGHSRRAPAVDWGVLVWGTLTLTLVVTGVMNGDRRFDQIVVAALTLVVLAELSTSPRLSSNLAKPVAVALALWIALVLAVSVIRGESWKPCDPLTGKCTPLGGLLAGGLRSENLLAIVAGFALLACSGGIWAERQWRQPRFLALPGALLCTVLLTGSRTPLIALGVSATVGVLTLRFRSTGRAPRRMFLFGVLIAVASVGVILLNRSAGSDLSFRGNLWASALNSADLGSLAGRGEVGWLRAQEAGLIPGHYPHSQYLLVLYFGGVIGFLWLLTLFGRRLEKIVRLRRPSVSMIAATPYVMTVGIAEVYWDPTGFDSGLLLLLAYLLLTVPGDGRAEEDDSTQFDPRSVAREARFVRLGETISR